MRDTSDVSDGLRERLRPEFSEARLLDLFLLCERYHTISFTACAARVPLGDGAPKFDPVR